MEQRKVVIIGDGSVGSSIAYTMLLGETVNELVIIDVNKRKAEGDVLDMIQGMPFVMPKKLKAGDYEDIKDAHIVIITAGVAQKPGETRNDLLKRNKVIFKSIIESMKPYLDEDAIVLVVTNPCDVLSYYTYKLLGRKSNLVIGSGTVLDTARLKSAIASHVNVDPRNVHTYVVGEHGDSEVAAYSATTIGGLPLSNYCVGAKDCEAFQATLHNLHHEVKNAAYEIIEKKGATFYAVALAVNKIVETILNNQRSILTVSTYVSNCFDGAVTEIYYSVPCIVSSKGVRDIIRIDYSDEEREALIRSGNIIKKEIATLMEE